MVKSNHDKNFTFDFTALIMRWDSIETYLVQQRMFCDSQRFILELSKSKNQSMK